MEPTTDNFAKPRSEPGPQKRPLPGLCSASWRIRRAALMSTTCYSAGMSLHLHSLMTRIAQRSLKVRGISDSNFWRTLCGGPPINTSK